MNTLEEVEQWDQALTMVVAGIYFIIFMGVVVSYTLYKTVSDKDKKITLLISTFSFSILFMAFTAAFMFKSSLTLTP